MVQSLKVAFEASCDNLFEQFWANILCNSKWNSSKYKTFSYYLYKGVSLEISLETQISMQGEKRSFSCILKKPCKIGNWIVSNSKETQQEAYKKVSKSFN